MFAGEIIYMAAPGALSPKLQLLEYKKLSADKKYPWIDNPEVVPLSAQVTIRKPFNV